MTDLHARAAALLAVVEKMTEGEWTAGDNKSGTATILYSSGRRIGELYSYSVYEPREDERRANGNAIAMLQTCAPALIRELLAENERLSAFPGMVQRALKERNDAQDEAERLRARVAELEAQLKGAGFIFKQPSSAVDSAVAPQPYSTAVDAGPMPFAGRDLKGRSRV